MDSTSAIILVVALFIIMMGMGLSLTIDDFKRVLKYPKAIFVGFLNQIILLPLIAYGFAVLLKVDGNIALGAMILAACPGGPTSNLVTHLAKGDTALSVSLTAVNSLITIVSIPFIVNFGVTEFISDGSQVAAPVGKIAGMLAVVLVTPLAIGMFINKSSAALAKKMDKPVRIASVLVLVLIIVGLCIKEKDNLVSYFEAALVISLCINVSTMLVGYLTSKVFGLNFKQSLSISIESGNQNGTLAIHVAANSLGNPAYAIVAAVYSLIMYFTAAIPVLIGINKDKQSK